MADPGFAVAVCSLFGWAVTHRLQRTCEQRASSHGRRLGYHRHRAEIERVKLAKRVRQVEEATDPGRRRFLETRARALSSRARREDWYAAELAKKERFWDFLS